MESTAVDEVLAQCRPSSVGVVVGAMWVVVLACSLVPQVYGLVELELPAVPMVLAGIGGVFSLLSYRFVEKRPGLTAGFLILDTLFYAGATISCAILSVPPTSYIFGGIFVVMSLHWGRAFSFSWLGLLLFTVLPLAGAILTGADLPLALIIFMGGVFFVFSSLNTRSSREQAEIRKRRELTIDHLSHVLMERYSESLREVQTSYGVMLHQLKNDLAPICGYVDFALEDFEAGVDPRGDLLTVQHTSRVMKERLHEFLGQVRAASSSNGCFRIDDLVNEMGSMVPRFPVNSPGIVFGDIPGVRVRGTMDSAKIAVRNLVTNAFEAGATRVVIDARELDVGGVALTVRDNGPGVPRQILDDLFEPFATHGKEHGTGLGLFICRSTMESIGGGVTLLESGPGGTAFELVFRACAENRSDSPT